MKQIMQQCGRYMEWFCSYMNRRDKQNKYNIRGEIEYSPKLGIAVITLHKRSKRSRAKTLFCQHETLDELQAASERIKRMRGKQSNYWSLYTFGWIAYSATKVRYVKPLISGYWTKEIAFWDAQLIECQLP